MNEKFDLTHVFTVANKEFGYKQTRKIFKTKIMALKPGPKRIAKSTGKPDRRTRDNKDTPGNTPLLKPPKRIKK
ncbi:MAG: hypothetical protein PHW82_11280 [Bacteroidales bacterium]|nr:hypothetical protein [Bacteroidales bacterium]